LESASPNWTEIHLELSRAYEKTGKAEDAAREMKLYDQSKRP